MLTLIVYLGRLYCQEYFECHDIRIFGRRHINGGNVPIWQYLFSGTYSDNETNTTFKQAITF